MSALHILVVDDNRTAAEAAAMLLERDGHSVTVCFDGATAIARLGASPFDLVLTDLRMEPVDGLAVVRAARALARPVDAIVITAFGSIEAAVEAMRHGAVDFLTKPVTAEVLLRRVRDFRGAAPAGLALVGESPAMEALRAQAVRLAPVRSAVLLEGETGTGRRHFARWLHQNGPDADRPLRVALPGRPITGLAEAGLVLLSAVDEWTDPALAELQRQLSVLEPGAAPRLVATAKPGLDARVAVGAFPAELYFRLAVLHLRIPPLRARPEDVVPLLRHFLVAHARALGRPEPACAPALLDALRAHAWLGNLRELSNLAERAVVLGAAELELPPRPAAEAQPAAAWAPGFPLSAHLEQVERRVLLDAIRAASGDRAVMGRMLGLERNTLRYKLNKYGLLERTGGSG